MAIPSLYIYTNKRHDSKVAKETEDQVLKTLETQAGNDFAVEDNGHGSFIVTSDPGSTSQLPDIKQLSESNPSSERLDLNTTFGTVKVVAIVDRWTREACYQITNTKDHTTVGQFCGKVDYGVHVDLQLDNFTGKVKLYLRNGHEVWLSCTGFGSSYSPDFKLAPL